MNRVRQVALGALVALISMSIVAGGISLALQESGRQLAILLPAPTPRPVNTVAPDASTPDGTGTATLFATQTPNPCPPPPGWVVVQVQSGDTLQDLAAAYGVTVELLAQENCLPAGVDAVPAGSTLNVPALTPTGSATATPTPADETACGPPSGWIPYIVEPRDTLFSLSRAYGITVAELQDANCLTGTLIVRGTVLYVPNVPTLVPSATPKPTQTVTPRPTRTPTPVQLQPTATNPPPTITPTSPASTPTPSPSSSPVPSNTATGTPTPTTTLLPTVTATGVGSVQTPTPGVPVSP